MHSSTSPESSRPLRRVDQDPQARRPQESMPAERGRIGEFIHGAVKTALGGKVLEMTTESGEPIDTLRMDKLRDRQVIDVKTANRTLRLKVIKATGKSAAVIITHDSKGEFSEREGIIKADQKVGDSFTMDLARKAKGKDELRMSPLTTSPVEKMKKIPRIRLKELRLADRKEGERVEFETEHDIYEFEVTGADGKHGLPVKLVNGPNGVADFIGKKGFIPTDQPRGETMEVFGEDYTTYLLQTATKVKDMYLTLPPEKKE